MTLGTKIRSATAVLLGGTLDLDCWRALAGDRHDALAQDADLGTLLTGLAGLVLCLAITWAVLLVALTALEPLTGHDLTTTIGCPPWLRRALLVLTGVVAAGAIVTNAGAAGAIPVPSAAYDDLGGAAASSTGAVVLDGRLDGLPLPERPLGARRPAAAEAVVVRPGDCLWSIARDRVGDADAWTALYALNHDRVGADPDLLRPGIRLRLELPIHEEE